MAGDTWETLSLGDLTENYDSVRVPVKQADRKVGEFPYYGASGIVDHINDYLFDGEYLLVAEDGENLRTRQTPVAFIATGKFWVNNHAHIVRGNEKATTRFLNYALLNTDISGYLTGSIMPKLTQGNMNRIPIQTPSLDEQKAIAHILGTLDEKIELNRRMNETLETIAQATFKSWFVDFDPVRAKVDGRKPAGMDDSTAALFPNQFENTSIGKVPDGWTECLLGEVLELKRGYDLPKTNRTPGPIPIYSSAGLTGFHSEAKVDGPTVITGRYGTIGRVFFVDEKVWPLNTTLYVRDFKGNEPRFIYYLLHSVNFYSYLDKAAVPGINRNHVHREPTVVPPLEIQRAFAKQVKPLWDRHAINQAGSETLATIRDTLLPKLLSGEIRVSEAEQTVAEVA